MKLFEVGQKVSHSKVMALMEVVGKRGEFIEFSMGGEM